MNNNSITLLYIKHLITPLEKIIRNPEFTTKYKLQEQQKIDQLLLHKYQELEHIIKEEQ